MISPRYLFKTLFAIVTVYVICRFLKSREISVRALFGGRNVETIELPQLQLKRYGLFPDLDESLYRTYNPTISSYRGKPIITYRISNYTMCGDKNYYIHNAITYLANKQKLITNHMAIVTDGIARRVELKYPNAPDRCVQGFEDPRTVVKGDELLLIANLHSGAGPAGVHGPEGCMNEMWMLKFPMTLLHRSNRRNIIQPSKMVRLRSPGSNAHDFKPRVEKNWMPFIADDGGLCFVYSVNPHVVLRCDESSGATKVIASTTNPRIDGNTRGGSQAVKYKGQYLAFTHTRDKNQYRTQLYAFSAQPPYQITHISRDFMFSAADVDGVLIQFVAGFEIINDIAYITYGEQDCRSWLCRIPMKDLVSVLQPV